jgi:hypothetical protein
MICGITVTSEGARWYRICGIKNHNPGYVSDKWNLYKKKRPVLNGCTCSITWVRKINAESILNSNRLGWLLLSMHCIALDLLHHLVLWTGLKAYISTQHNQYCISWDHQDVNILQNNLWPVPHLNPISVEDHTWVQNVDVVLYWHWARRQEYYRQALTRLSWNSPNPTAATLRIVESVTMYTCIPQQQSYQ